MSPIRLRPFLLLTDYMIFRVFVGKGERKVVKYWDVLNVASYKKARM